jgi:hypothetical protein
MPWTRHQCILFTSAGTPHVSVLSNTFWKHLTPSLPEPVKVRHLFLWLTKRVLEGGDPADENAVSRASKGKSKQKPSYQATSRGEALMKDILIDLLVTTANGEVDTNVFPEPVGVKRPCRERISADPLGSVLESRVQNRQLESSARILVTWRTRSTRKPAKRSLPSGCTVCGP